MRAKSGGVLVGIGAAALIAASASAAFTGDPKIGPLKITYVPTGITWQDQPDEASYHVSGSVTYWQTPSCAPDRAQVDGERVSFDETLPADTTSFAYPTPADARLTLKKEFVVNLQALDANGASLVGDGFAVTVEAVDPSCTNEEIAAGLAAAGSGGPTSGDSGRPLVGAMLLGMLSIAALATAGQIRRRTSRC